MTATVDPSAPREPVSVPVTAQDPGTAPRLRAEACTMVIFGATGDLTKRKLFPALYALAYRKLLPEHFAIVGVSRTPQSSKAFASTM